MMFHLAFFLLSISVHGWSGDAHRVISDIAGYNTQENTRYILYSWTETINFNALKEWMKDESTWADEGAARSSSAGGESGKNHFVHTTKSCEPFDMARDCGDEDDPGVCLVTAIRNHIQTIVSPSVTEPNRRRSLKYLIHYMGDIHQPLHVGFRDDQGGNDIHDVSPFGVDLHNIWDNGLVHESKDMGRFGSFFGGYGYSASLAHSISREMKGNTRNKMRSVDLNSKSDVIRMIAEIADETSSQVTCPISYHHGDPSSTPKIKTKDSVDPNYISSGANAVAVQISKAGLRLGFLLDAIVETYEENVIEARRLADELAAMQLNDKLSLEVRKAERNALKKTRKEAEKIERKEMEALTADRNIMIHEDTLARAIRAAEKEAIRAQRELEERMQAEENERIKAAKKQAREAEKILRKQSKLLRKHIEEKE